MIPCFPENYKVIEGTSPVTTSGGVTADYVSLKNVNRAWIVLSFTQAVAHETGIDPKRATAVDGTGAVVLNKVVPIKANEDCAASDALVDQTAAITYDLTEDIKHKMVMFQIDPALLGEGYDVLGCVVDDSSQATNFVQITYILDMIWKQATPPSAIVD